MTESVRNREDIPEAYRWNTHVLYESDDLWEAEMQSVEASLPALAALQGTLTSSADTLLAALQQRDATSIKMDRLLVYATFRRDEDTSNAFYQGRYERVLALGARYGTATAFFRPEILALDDETFAIWFREQPELVPYRFPLSELRRRRTHMRSAEVEQVLASAAELIEGPATIFTALNNADLQFGTIEHPDGRTIELTHGNIWALFFDLNRDFRRTVAEQVQAEYAAHLTTFAASLSSAVRGHVFAARMRGYESALEAALDPDDIPPAVYHSLIDTVHAALPRGHRYIELRRRVLGLDAVRSYDMRIPLSKAPMPEVMYDQARSTMLGAFAPLGDEYVSMLRKGLYEERWIDVYPSRHKKSGAYSWSAYGTQPYILISWQNIFDDLLVLAHELGHAMHSAFTLQTQPYSTSAYTAFVAEVASTCNEVLLLDHLLKTTTDRDVKRGMLDRFLGNFGGTLFLQTMFAEFEREIHARIERGEALDAAGLSEQFGRLSRQYFGPSYEVTDIDRATWAEIPHFYLDFYVYKYATGISAGVALAYRILSEGQPAVERYLTFLRGGNSKSSIDLLKDAGVDLTTPRPIEQAITVFESLLNQLEALIDGDTTV